MDDVFDIELIRADAARHYGVPPDIHPEDMIWHFISRHPAYPTPQAAANYYFADGAESARKLDAIVQEHLPSRNASRGPRILEFASGYGMVTRHLAKLASQREVIACDIHEEAIEFVRSRLQQRALPSKHLPEEVSFDEPFDVVFALSFFSHMPAATFGRWLKALFSAVNPTGILVFTTHGLASRAHFGNIVLNEDGFWFKPTSEQADLNPNEYGSSVTAPKYVVNQLAHLEGASLAEFRRAFWWGHQDLYVVSRG